MPIISDELLEILVCPIDRTPLVRADDALVERVNRAIAQRRLRNKAGETLEKPLDAGLLRADGTLLYPVIDQIPIMLADEAIPLDQLAAKE